MSEEIEQPAVVEESTSPLNESAVVGERMSPLEEPALIEEPMSASEEPALVEEPMSASEEPALVKEPMSASEEPALIEEPMSASEEPALIEEPMSAFEQPAYESSASLRVTNGPLMGPVLCRVVSIMLARAHCPMDRLDDVLLLCDALSAHAPEHAVDGHLAFAVSVRGGQFELRVGELAERAAGRLVGDAVLPGVGSVLERVTDELRIESATDGAGEELVLGMFF